MSHGIISGSALVVPTSGTWVLPKTWVNAHRPVTFTPPVVNLPKPEKPVDKPEPPRSRIKMIAVGPRSAVYTNTNTLEIDEGIISVPYVLTHDDRIYQFNPEDESWDELPPIPDL